MNFMENFLAKKKGLITVLYTLGYLTSGFVTWLLLSSHSAFLSSKIVWSSITIVMECGKALCLIYGLKAKSKAFMAMGVFLTLLSISASLGFAVLENNYIENSVTATNMAFDEAKAKQTRLTEQIATKKALLEKATSEKSNAAANFEKDKSSVQKQIDEYNKTIKGLQANIREKNDDLQYAILKKWVNTPDKLRGEIAQLTDSMNKTIAARDKLQAVDKSDIAQSNIDKISAEIDSLNKEVNSIDLSKNVPQKATAGFYALFQLLSSIIGISPQVLEFGFYFAITAAFEILISMLFLMSVFGSSESIFSAFTNFRKKISLDKPNYSPAPATASMEEPATMKKIGFDTSKIKVNSPTPPQSTQFSDEDFKKYVTYMYSNARKTEVGLESPGYEKISKNVEELTLKKCRYIHGHLQSQGVINTVGKRTIIARPNA